MAKKEDSLEDLIRSTVASKISFTFSSEGMLERELLFLLDRIDETKAMHTRFISQLKSSRGGVVEDLIKLYPHPGNYFDSNSMERNHLKGRIIEIESAIRREEKEELEKLQALRSRLLYVLNQFLQLNPA